LARLLGKKCVQTWHESRIREYDWLLILGLDNLISVRKVLISSLPKLKKLLLSRIPFTWIPGASLLPTANLTRIQLDDIRHQFVKDGEVLLVFFGFMAPLKGIEALFDVMVRMNDAILVMVSDLRMEDSYHRSLIDKMIQMNISSRVFMPGFLPDEKLAELMAAADAVVLPFRDGGGDWNTSIDGAISQGVFVLTTSLEKRGYDTDTNVYFVAPGDVNEMISALQKFAGNHVYGNTSSRKWNEIALQHVKIYRQLLNND
jgi:glycosyltransferase involved in cell wall biosynthesis